MAIYEATDGTQLHNGDLTFVALWVCGYHICGFLWFAYLMCLIHSTTDRAFAQLSNPYLHKSSLDGELCRAWFRARPALGETARPAEEARILIRAGSLSAAQSMYIFSSAYLSQPGATSLTCSIALCEIQSAAAMPRSRPPARAEQGGGQLYFRGLLGVCALLPA